MGPCRIVPLTIGLGFLIVTWPNRLPLQNLNIAPFFPLSSVLYFELSKPILLEEDNVDSSADLKTR